MTINLNLERLIGKPIEEASKLGKIIETRFDSYYFEPNSNIEFFDASIGNLQISFNPNKIIESISVPFSVILDKSFFTDFTKIYGYPNSILAYDQLLTESKSSIEEGFKQNLSKRIYSMKEVLFDDKPFFILWNKNDYQIKMTFYYKQSATQLIFRKPTEAF